MKDALKIYQKELESIRESGTYKDERVITTPQKARIDTTKAHGVLNMCANNYLGLSDNPGASACRRSVLSAAPRAFTKSLRKKSPAFSKWMTPFCILPALMPTAACSKPC